MWINRCRTTLDKFGNVFGHFWVSNVFGDFRKLEISSFTPFGIIILAKFGAWQRHKITSNHSPKTFGCRSHFQKFPKMLFFFGDFRF